MFAKPADLRSLMPPRPLPATSSYRHARTCSGHLPPPLPLLHAHIPFRPVSGAPAGPAVSLSLSPDPLFVTPASEPGPIPDSRHRRRRWRAGSTAETAARTKAGPRIKSGATVGGYATPGQQPDMCEAGKPFPRAASWMPGTSPLLSGLDFADRAHGLDSTGFQRVPSDRDTDQRPASQPTPRHARTCSGHPCGRAAEAVEGDARNKSGHDGEGRSGMMEREQTGEAVRARKLRPTPVHLHPMAEPDSSGTSPGMTEGGVRA